MVPFLTLFNEQLGRCVELFQFPLFSLQHKWDLITQFSHSFLGCSKCRTLKTSSQTVSVQVQSVRFQSPGHIPHGYNPVNYQRRPLYYWAQSCQLSVSIQTLAINPALNATQGHKRSYQTSSQSSCTKYQGTISALVFLTRTQLL